MRRPNGIRVGTPDDATSGLWQRLEAEKMASIGSRNLKDAILAAFPYGTGEVRSVANSQFKRLPPPTLTSNGRAMT